MRMRKKKHGAERLAACAALLKEKPDAPIASSYEDFGREARLCAEIGCGKGGFACGMAEKYPDSCFYAVEKIENVMVIAVEKAMLRQNERPHDNLRFIVADATALPEWFMPHTLDAIYLNFSDPWPKKGHTKRRLTHRNFLLMYFRLLKESGALYFKTDNRGLFDFTLEELDAIGIKPDYVTYDLHNSTYNDGNVMTEYEENFSSQGMPIHALGVTVPHGFTTTDVTA